MAVEAAASVEVEAAASVAVEAVAVSVAAGAASVGAAGGGLGGGFGFFAACVGLRCWVATHCRGRVVTLVMDSWLSWASGE